MIVYHEVDHHLLASVLRGGIQLGKAEGKRTRPDIQRADEYLDARRPESLRRAGVCRGENIYAYVGDETAVRDIRDGRQVSLAALIAESTQAVLRLDVAPQYCYISDLDAFDAVKRALHGQQPSEVSERLADKYWRRVTPLAAYNDGAIARPEVMITRDVAPEQIRRVS